MELSLVTPTVKFKFVCRSFSSLKINNVLVGLIDDGELNSCIAWSRRGCARVLAFVRELVKRQHAPLRSDGDDDDNHNDKNNGSDVRHADGDNANNIDDNDSNNDDDDDNDDDNDDNDNDGSSTR